MHTSESVQLDLLHLPLYLGKFYATQCVTEYPLDLTCARTYRQLMHGAAKLQSFRA